MAIPVSPSMYSAGAVELDSQPTTNMYAHLMAKREALDKAKNDTFDEYIRGLNTKITPAGVRTADLEAFNDRKNKWVYFGMKNKEKLMKGDVPTQTEFNKLYQEAANIPIESKAAEEQKKPFVDIITDPNKRKHLSSNVFKDIEVHDQPLYIKDAKTGEYVRNYNRKPIDYNSKIFNPDFDFNKGYEGWAKDMDRSETIGNVVSRDKVTGRANVEFTKAYTPEQIKQISLNAAKSAEDGGENNDYYQLRYEKIYKDPAEAKRLNDAFQEVYGKEIKLPNGQKIPNYIDSPEEVAAAEAILQAKAMTEKGTKPAQDKELAFQRAQVNINLNKGGDGGGRQVGNAFDDFTDADFGNFYTKGGVFYNKDGTPKEGKIFITGAVVPGTVRSALKAGGFDIADLNKGVDAELKNGQIVSISNKKIGAITRQSMEGVYQPKMDTERKGEHLNFNDKSKPQVDTQKPPSNVPSYSKDALKKSGWTDAQIQTAVKAGKIKVN